MTRPFWLFEYQRTVSTGIPVPSGSLVLQIAGGPKGSPQLQIEMKVADRSKRYRSCAELVDPAKIYSLAEAVETLKKLPPTKFDQTVTLSFRLGVDPRQSDQMVRGTCPLPYGSGKKVRVLVFAQGQAAEAATEAGAEYVGFEDLIRKCQEGFQDFDVAIATPAGMSQVRKLGKVLGTRRLMPNPKTGTVKEDKIGRAHV